MKYGWLILFFVLSGTIAYAQSSSKVKELERQRKAALAEIEMTNQLLNETKKTARNSLNRLNLLTQQIASRKKLINLLNDEVAAIDNQVVRMNREIGALEKELKVKQQNYSKSAQGMYKRRTSQDKMLFILSADNFAQSVRRLRYLREYADWQKRQASEIIDERKEIALKQQALEKTRGEKRALLGNREIEAKKLLVEESSQKEEVQELGKKQSGLQADLKKKQQQANALNRQIEAQIAEEIARAEAEARAERERIERERIAARKRAAELAAARKKSAELKRQNNKEAVVAKPEPEPEPEPVSEPEPVQEQRVAEVKGGYAMTRAEKKLSDDFGRNQGALPFPVSGRYTVVSRFGEQQHQELKYVRTNNSGIDIQVQPGAEARAVFSGEVTRVFVVPGYNNSVIIRHGNYLTVYSNLVNVYVKAGDRVSTRQAIGKIYSDTEDGNTTILHFQLWKEKTKLNPLPWLD